MKDLNTLRSEFEALPQIKGILIGGEFYFSTLSMNYKPKNSQNENYLHCTYFLNGGWYAFQEKSKAQAVPEGYVLIKKEDIENWYLDESEYMWFEADGIDGYLEDIDIGEVVEVQRKEYVVTNSNPVFAAKPWDDNGNYADTWEFFESKDEAEKAAAHCKAMYEASESGAEG
ncbi:hypothetical protein [Acinetobacter nosocomialis]|uniref:hypothetical protein n=1 Tax=Acinetobacter nosocomialis TaxID=106654 RepID=UPI0024DEF497|nr:hypothetical protein [Acinetobacter nosocomialis]